MPRTVSNLPGPVASWIMGALARGQRVYYFIDDPSGYVGVTLATDHLGRPVINEGEGAGGQQMYRNITKAETLPLYRITLLSLELPEKNNLYIFATVTEPGLIYTSQRGMATWTDGVNEDSAFYASPTVKYRRVCVTPDNRVFPQEQITGFSSGQDKAILAAVAVAVAGYWAFGGGGAAAGAEAAAGGAAAGTEAAAGGAAAGTEAAAGAGFVGPMAPAVAGTAGSVGEGITLADIGKAAVGVAKGAATVAGAVTQVSAALKDPGGGNTAPPPEPPVDNTIYWMVGGAILVIGVIL